MNNPIDKYNCKLLQKLRDTKKTIILFGAGGKGRSAIQFLKTLGIEPAFFCDNNVKLQGQQFCGKEIFSYAQLCSKFKNSLAAEDAVILVTTCALAASQIIAQLKQDGNKIEVCHFCMPFKIDNVLYSPNLHRTSLDIMIDNMGDDLSRTIYKHFIDYKTTGNGLPLLNYLEGDSFFDASLIFPSPKHVYVDLGAYTGDTLLRFYAFCRGQYRKLIAVEPDPQNYQKILKMVEYGRLEDITIYNTGCWSENCVLQLRTGTLGYENATFFSDTDIRGRKYMYDWDCGKNEDLFVDMPVATLDTLLADRKFPVTVLKVNALAADLESLQGGKNILIHDKPIVITDFGSRPNAITGIPELLLKCNPNYTFYLRQKNIFGDSKTVLYAINKEL